MIEKRKKDPYTEVSALGKHICMSPHKARRVIDQIRGRSYEETLMIVELMSYRTCYPILKLVYSAVANASHNMNFNEANLVISKAEVNEGTAVKKLKPRARGRGYLIKRPTCHITIVLKNLSLYELYEDYEEYNIGVKKSGWKKKISPQLWHLMICRVVEDYGTKNKSTWFQTWYNPRLSFSLVCTIKKLF